MKQIKIDHDEGAYGRTIMITSSNIQALIFIKRLFERLSIENNLEVEMANLENVEIIGLQSLRLKQSSRESALGGHLKMEEQSLFIWTRSKEGWNECAELVDGIICSGIASHQYLTAEDYDDALVVISLQQHGSH